MGLSIHYNGRINESTSLTKLIEEVKDIVEVYKWEYTIYETQFPSQSLGTKAYNNEIYGISFTPPECETVFLCFLSNGKMSSPIHLLHYGHSSDTTYQEYLYMLSVKTQYAGIEIHKLVLHILKHISKNHLSDFQLMDEGKYWETWDEKVLQDRFSLYNSLIGRITTALETFPKNQEETFEDYFIRVLGHSKNKE